MKKYICTLYLVPVLLAALSSTSAKADDVVIDDEDDPNAPITYVTLKWDPNPERDVIGYNVYYGRGSGDYVRLETVDEATARIGVKGTRTVYFAVTAFNADGVESQFSEEVHWP
jgi:hypothetical protein